MTDFDPTQFQINIIAFGPRIYTDSVVAQAKTLVNCFGPSALEAGFLLARYAHDGDELESKPVRKLLEYITSDNVTTRLFSAVMVNRALRNAGNNLSNELTKILELAEAPHAFGDTPDVVYLALAGVRHPRAVEILRHHLLMQPGANTSEQAVNLMTASLAFCDTALLRNGKLEPESNLFLEKVKKDPFLTDERRKHLLGGQELSDWLDAASFTFTQYQQGGRELRHIGAIALDDRPERALDMALHLVSQFRMTGLPSATSLLRAWPGPVAKENSAPFLEAYGDPKLPAEVRMIYGVLLALGLNNAPEVFFTDLREGNRSEKIIASCALASRKDEATLEQLLAIAKDDACSADTRCLASFAWGHGSRDWPDERIRAERLALISDKLQLKVVRASRVGHQLLSPEELILYHHRHQRLPWTTPPELRDPLLNSSLPKPPSSAEVLSALDAKVLVVADRQARKEWVDQSKVRWRNAQTTVLIGATTFTSLAATAAAALVPNHRGIVYIATLLLGVIGLAGAAKQMDRWIDRKLRREAELE